MKVTELMIGDWVYSLIDIDGNTVREPQRIRGISVDTDGAEEICTINTDKNDVWYRIETFEPIPLTTEILLRNGFEKSDGISDTPPYDKDEEGNMHFSFRDRFWGWWQPDNIFCIPAYGMEWLNLKYIHQLQHAMLLGGITKEIKI